MRALFLSLRFFSRRLASLAPIVTLASLVVTSCAPPKTAVDFALPTGQLGGQFLDTPWPSDLMIAGGKLDLSLVPNPTASSTLEDAIALFSTNTAYPATGTLFFRVAAGVDESTLPIDAAASLAEGASMFLVETADVSKRIPIEWKTYPEGTLFLPKNTVAVQPLLGAVPKGRFALVVTSNARAKDGSALGASSDLAALLACTPVVGARAVDCAPYQQLVKDLNVPAESLALVQMVTPHDSTSGLVDAAEVVRALSPSVNGLFRRTEHHATYDVYEGTAGIAQLQAGTPPFAQLDKAGGYVSGGFVLGSDGKPVVQRVEQVPFVVTVPHQAMPAGGYCAVVYGHGTGGDLNSGLGDDASAEAFQVGQAGCAMFAMSEPIHNTRVGYPGPSQVESLTFNFFNPVAGRDIWRQSAMEKVQLVTVAQHLVIPASVTGAADIKFDASKVGYFGHSQGGIVGALFVAVEPRINGAFLSGAGAGFGASLVEKVDPVAIAGVLKTVLSLPPEEEIDLFHPVIALLQSWVDPADPINFGDLWHDRGAVDGQKRPHLIVTSGLKDTFTPPRCHGALAGAFRIPIAAPVSKDVLVVDLELGDQATAPATLNGNLDGTTAGVLQYPDDGHFAVFNNVNAQAALRAFFTTLNTDGTPIVQVR